MKLYRLYHEGGSELRIGLITLPNVRSSEPWAGTELELSRPRVVDFLAVLPRSIYYLYKILRYRSACIRKRLPPSDSRRSPLSMVISHPRPRDLLTFPGGRLGNVRSDQSTIRGARSVVCQKSAESRMEASWMHRCLELFDRHIPRFFGKDCSSRQNKRNSRTRTYERAFR